MTGAWFDSVEGKFLPGASWFEEKWCTTEEWNTVEQEVNALPFHGEEPSRGPVEALSQSLLGGSGGPAAALGIEADVRVGIVDVAVSGGSGDREALLHPTQGR